MRFAETGMYKAVTTGILAVALVSGCATTQQAEKAEKKTGPDGALVLPVPETIDIKETTQYLPIQDQKDQTGNLLPYEESKNPYLLNKSQVSKGSVLLFLEAKKALKAGNTKLAEQKLRVITKNEKKLSGPWVMLAEIAMKKDDRKQAISHLNQAIKLNPQNVNAYIALASIQRLQGEFREAQNTLARSLALWPDFPEAHYNLGILYDTYLNEEIKAQKHLEAYLFLNKGNDHDALLWYVDLVDRTGVKKGFVGQKLEESPFLKDAELVVVEEE